MGKLLLVVEDHFQLSGRGLLVLPYASPDSVGTNKGGHKTAVRLLRPDGTEAVAEATFYWDHLNPGGFHYACYFVDGTKEQVPIGTEIWLPEAQ